MVYCILIMNCKCLSLSSSLSISLLLSSPLLLSPLLLSLSFYRYHYHHRYYYLYHYRYHSIGIVIIIIIILNSALFWVFFGVVLISCRVNFHVVRSDQFVVKIRGGRAPSLDPPPWWLKTIVARFDFRGMIMIMSLEIWGTIPGGYSLWWPIRGGSARMGKGRDFTRWCIKG